MWHSLERGMRVLGWGVLGVGMACAQTKPKRGFVPSTDNQVIESDIQTSLENGPESQEQASQVEQETESFPSPVALSVPQPVVQQGVVARPPACDAVQDRCASLRNEGQVLAGQVADIQAACADIGEIKMRLKHLYERSQVWGDRFGVLQKQLVSLELLYEDWVCYDQATLSEQTYVDLQRWLEAYPEVVLQVKIKKRGGYRVKSVHRADKKISMEVLLANLCHDTERAYQAAGRKCLYYGAQIIAWVKNLPGDEVATDSPTSR